VNVSILGCGAIGSFVAKWLREKNWLASLYDANHERALELSKTLGVSAAKTFEEFLKYDADIVVEAASRQAVRDHAESILVSGKDMLVMSVGAFADSEFYDKIRRLAERLGRRIYMPSGAIAGIDALAAVAETVDEVILTTRENPSSLDVEREGAIFEGNGREAAKNFPRNANVAAILSLVVGFEKVRCKVIADNTEENVHEIVARGKFGEIRIEVRNRKMPEKPKDKFLSSSFRDKDVAKPRKRRGDRMISDFIIRRGLTEYLEEDLFMETLPGLRKNL